MVVELPAVQEERASPPSLQLQGLGSLGRNPSSPLSGLSGRRLSAHTQEAAALADRTVSLERSFSQTERVAAPAAPGGDPRSLGSFLASRLADLGICHFFGVPGDFNLALLDELIAEPRLRMISTCNELNAGYAADGYARARGLAAMVTTFSVGGLSALNAVAGAYSEDLPLVCIVGAPHSGSWGSQRVMHHTLGKAGDLDFELNCYKQVTCYQAQIRDLDSAYGQINRALAAAVAARKPVYISIPCNFATVKHPAFAPEPVPFSLPAPISVPAMLEAALSKTAAFMNKAVKPVLVCGAHMRSPRARAAMVALAEATGMPVAVMVNSKGFFPEDHPAFIGTFWSSLSSPCTGETVVAADAYLFAGPVFHDVATAGFTHMIAQGSMVEVQPDSVTLGTSGFFGQVLMEDFLEGLASKVKRNSAALVKYRQMYIPRGVPPAQPAGTPLFLNRVYKHLQGLLRPDHAVLVDAGDSWFNAAKLHLPGACAFEIQACYASIGWSVGAALGYGLGAPGRRVVQIVGDGAFQMTAQELSTIMRYRVNPVIVLINNGTYEVEAEIHDGPYNELHGWDYCRLADAMDNGSGALLAIKVGTEEECEAAFKRAAEVTDRTVLIECIIKPDDCSVEVLQLGKLMMNANSKA